jgi:CRISPR system Cascade subunit CasC
MMQTTQEKNFINFHVLISHSPSCLNRDDMNMQKSAIFGGKRRVRISSQSLKRAMRTSDYYKKNLGQKSIRTRQLKMLVDEFERLFSEDRNLSIEKQWIEKGIQVLSSTVVIDNEEADDEDNTVSVAKKIAVAPWALSEFKFVCKKIKETYDKDLDEKQTETLKKAIEKEHKRKTTKNKPRLTDDDVKEIFMHKMVGKELEDDANALAKACGETVDIALSGRMATSGLMTNIDGALSIAHAITTHAVDADIDWFTAVDDLQELGSGHLDTQEFSSGVFYRYASLNVQQLQKNLGDASRSKALEIAAHVLHMLATEVPSAKQQSFAAHNLADQALVSFSDQPVSLANAFEQPVQANRKGGFRSGSVKALNDHWKRVHDGFALNERCAVFALEPIDLPGGIYAKQSLPELEGWVRNDGIDNIGGEQSHA